MKIRLFVFLCLFSLLLPPQAKAIRLYAATSRTGGGTGALDAIDKDPAVGQIQPADGDIAIVIIPDGARCTYYLDGTSGAAEDGLLVIKPDDETGSKRWLLSKNPATITSTIPKPLNIDEEDNLILFENRTEMNFRITKIYSRSDTDDVNFTLKEMNDMTDFSNTTTIEAITIDTNGINVFYDELLSDIDHTLIESGHAIAFDNDPTDNPDSITISIVGTLGG